MADKPLVRRRNQLFKGLGFITPNLAIFLLFTLGPVLFTLGLAFFRWDPFTGATFVGFGNFNHVLTDSSFWYYLLNTLVFMIGLPLSMAGSLFLAVVLSQKVRGVLAYRSIFYLPSITNGVALFLLWKVMYNREAGLVNALGLPVVNFVRWVTGHETIGMKQMPSWLEDAWLVPDLVFALVIAVVLGLILLMLRGRLQGSRISVLTIKPGPVDTPMTAHLEKSALFARPEDVGAAIHRAMRRERNGSLYVPRYWRLVMTGLRAVPEALFRRLPL